MNLNKLLNSRKLKYGAVAILFSAAFIAVVIVANLIFTALDDKYNLKYDMTSDSIFTISQATEEILSDIDDEITIKFLMPLDKAAEAEYSNTGFVVGKYIVECAESYAQKFDNIKIEYVDMVRSPAEINKYRQSGDIKTTSVIVESSLRYKIISQRDFLANDGTYIVGFNGEMKFTSAILEVTNPSQPVVTFTANHGEPVDAKLHEAFINAGYIVEYKDLSLDPINSETKIIVINNPTTDFLGLNSAKEGGISEIELLNDYMNNFGHIMVFFSADNTAQLPELEELLTSRGIKVNRGSVIKDMGMALSSDGYMSVASPAGEMYGSTITNGITARMVTTLSSPIDILFTDKETSDDGSYVYTSGTTYVDPVLSTSANSEAVMPDGTVTSGPFNTMVLSSKYNYVNNEKKYSHLLVTSTGYFANFVGDTSYGNEKLLYNAMKLMGQEKVPTDIGYKLFDSQTLEKIDQKAITNWAWFLIAVIPVTVAVIGLVVWLRRRHR